MSTRVLVTSRGIVDHPDDAAIDELLDRLRKNGDTDGDDKPPRYAYLVMDQIVDGTFAVLDTIDTKVDGLMDAIIQGHAQGKLTEITKFSHQVSELRRVLGAQQDLFQRLVSPRRLRGQ